MRLLTLCLCLLLFTAFEFRVIDQMHQKHNLLNVEVASGILTGYPRLRVWQSRLLGPTMVGALTDVTGLPFIKSYRFICFALLTLANFLYFYLFRKVSGSNKTAWTYTLAGAILFIVLQDRIELHTWDFIDLCMMALFAWAVFRGAPLWSLIALFFVELLNREAAFFIALWIILDSFSTDSFSRESQRERFSVNWKKAALGVMLLAAGILWTHFARSTYLVEQTADFGGRLRQVGGQFWALPHTLTLLDRAHLLDALTPFVIVGATGFLLRRAWSALRNRAWKIGVLLGAFLSANLMMGVLTETRIWFVLIPFLLWLNYIQQSEEPSEEPFAASPA